jgi:biotin synthase
MAPRSAKADLPEQIRVSLGSAIVLELMKGKLDAQPTTAYLMTYKEGKCSANCGFCPQARESSSRADMLSRVSWPVFPTKRVLEGLKKATKSGAMKRACIQALNYPEVFMHLQALTSVIKQQTDVAVSVSCQPLNGDNIKLLADTGVERIGIPLDAATEELFDKIKGASAGGPYDWKKQFKLLEEAVSVFGKGKVSTHLIAGLGETETEMVKAIQKCVDVGVVPALFAFTPIDGTALVNMTQPAMQSYRRVQTARDLIVHGVASSDRMLFDARGILIDFGIDRRTLKQVVRSGEPFLTSGCPDCNRPYYNEKPSGPIYNYPRKLTEEELDEILMQSGLDGA